MNRIKNAANALRGIEPQPIVVVTRSFAGVDDWYRLGQLAEVELLQLPMRIFSDRHELVATRPAHVLENRAIRLRFGSCYIHPYGAGSVCIAGFALDLPWGESLAHRLLPIRLNFADTLDLTYAIRLVGDDGASPVFLPSGQAAAYLRGGDGVSAVYGHPTLARPCVGGGANARKAR